MGIAYLELTKISLVISNTYGNGDYFATGFIW